MRGFLGFLGSREIALSLLISHALHLGWENISWEVHLFHLKSQKWYIKMVVKHVSLDVTGNEMIGEEVASFQAQEFIYPLEYLTPLWVLPISTTKWGSVDL